MSDEKPDLAAVLEHYGADTSRKMVSCPLHEDREPSCSINYEKGVWRCHSCGEGGDSFTLIMKKEGVTFVGARDFAASLGIATGGAGGGSGEIHHSAYAGGGTVSRRTKKGSNSGRGSYRPSWRS